jgi:xanthine dehydrogenase molybdenum-binding subunit
VIRQIVAEALGVLPEQVKVNATDTATCPWDVGTHASRGAFMAGNAALLACRALKEKLLNWAEKVFPEEAQKNLRKYLKKQGPGKTPEGDWKKFFTKDNFLLEGGWLFLKKGPEAPWARLEFSKLIRAIHFRDRGTMFTQEAFYEPATDLPDWKKGYGNLSANYAYGTQGVEVEVDTETGEVKILKMVAVHDVGRVLNPQTLRGQAYGALAQGIGFALYEEVKTEKGKILNPGFTDYKIPSAVEMDFPVDLEFVETDDASGPFGAKGVGEPGLVPTAPALANAVYDAVGVRINDLPITPEKVLKALKEKSAKARSFSEG